VAALPRDIPDVYLAPVVLAVDARISELSGLDVEALAFQVALASDQPESTRSLRESGLITAIQHHVDCHGWTIQWDARGIRLSHDEHSLVLGVPPTFAEYLSGVSRKAGAARPSKG
jgi:hypothetical protein